MIKIYSYNYYPKTDLKQFIFVNENEDKISIERYGDKQILIDSKKVVIEDIKECIKIVEEWKY